MYLPGSAILRVASVVVLSALAVSAVAQNSIQLFSPVDVRYSSQGTGYGPAAVNFNTTILNLTCPSAPITAVLSSSADNTGYVLVDNNINVSVTSGGVTTGPVNVCKGGINTSPIGPFENCFTTSYGDQASPGNLNGQSPDNFVSTGGVPPLDISNLFSPGSIQVKVDLQDEGFYLTSSTIYLNTNCSQGGVTGPALISGNPISTTNPTPEQLSQDFSFNPSPGQQIGFEYDLTEAQAANSLTISDGTIPQTGDSPVDPALFQSTLVPGTSFATSSCLIHTGELLPNGQPACKLYTLECKVGTGATATGAACPISLLSNEIFRDTFSGGSFTLPDITTPGGVTFHQGVGFLMAAEGWLGGPCLFDPASGLQDLPCPQNLLTTFTGSSASQQASSAARTAAHANSVAKLSGIHSLAASITATSQYTGTGRTTHPNSTFITIAQVPEDLTTVTVAGQKPGGWINSSTASVTFSSQPPDLVGTGLPGAVVFVASPIQSITYGIAPAANAPVPGGAITTDTTLTNSGSCAPGILAASYTPGQQVFSGLADGQYLLHYYAQDCAGTEELKFTQDGTGVWSTNFYTVPINVDTAAPSVASGPAFSAAGPFSVGQTVTASYSCTDALSGIVSCGGHIFAIGHANTGPLTSTIDTSSTGSKSFTVIAIDAAGNQSQASVTYQVTSPYDNQIQLNLGSTTATYPQGTTLTIHITPPPANNAVAARTGLHAAAAPQTHIPTGTVKLFDGTKLLDTEKLDRTGTAYVTLRNLAAGAHSLSVTYSGDTYNPAGKSAPVTFTVQPAPVRLQAACWDAPKPFGTDYVCAVYASAPGTIPTGVVTYRYDGGTATSQPLIFGISAIVIKKPPVGKHSVIIGYAAQGSFAAAPSLTESFTVTPPKK